MATRYYTLNTATTPATLLPLALPIAVDGRLVLHPTPAQAAQHGAYPRADDAPPTPPEGKVAVPDGWEARDGAWRRTYRHEDAPPAPPRVFSKLKVVAALMDVGVWPKVKAWIEEAGLYDIYLAAQDFAEDNEYFAQGLAALKPVAGWTDEQVEALLAQCVKEGGAR